MPIKEASAAIIIPYFGSWPSYFSFYLKGCEGNPWLDVFFFTDCPTPKKSPPNVHFLSSSLKSVCKLATGKLGFPVTICSAYKLCDLKPFYGLIFDDYLTQYSYWGYGDIDLIYGDMGKYFLPKMESEIDIISSRRELLAGSFALYKNNKATCNLGHCIPGVQAFLNAGTYAGIDETFGCNITWTGGSKLELPETCMTYQAALAHRENRLKVSFDTVCREYCEDKDRLFYRRPALLANGEDCGYFHYVTNKGKNGFYIPCLGQVPDEFWITQTGYYSLQTIKWMPLLKQWRKTLGMGKDLWIRGASKIKRTILKNLNK